ncbi:hypothetical protein ACWIWK_09045 [Helicobacter sp. 23-1048]
MTKNHCHTERKRSISKITREIFRSFHSLNMTKKTPSLRVSETSVAICMLSY